MANGCLIVHHNKARLPKQFFFYFFMMIIASLITLLHSARTLSPPMMEDIAVGSAALLVTKATAGLLIAATRMGRQEDAMFWGSIEPKTTKSNVLVGHLSESVLLHPLIEVKRDVEQDRKSVV